MKSRTIQEIMEVVGGRLKCSRDACVTSSTSILGKATQTSQPQIQTICTDSRHMEPSSLFIAIKGDTHDGHKHLSEAAVGGAIAALVQEVPTDAPPNLPLIQITDTRIAMGKLATHVRRQLHGKVIAVAGSNGKTSTKYLIDAVLSGKLKGTMSPKSFNNDIGVPLTIFLADPNHDYVVLEMGTNHHGEILKLAQMAQPDIVVITNIGAEHLEFLGDLAGVRRENATIIDGLNPNGLLVVNGDDAELLDAVAKYPGKRITFGFKDTNDIFTSDIHCNENGVTFQLNGTAQGVTIPMLGRHTACNALAAIAVARHFGVDDQMIINSLAHAKGPQWRLQLQTIGGVTVLNDAYNANPNSMRAALETIRDFPVEGRRIAILGDMRELGESSETFHHEIGALTATCNLDMLVCVGPYAVLIANTAETAGMDRTKVVHFNTAKQCAGIAPRWLQAGDLVLLKASRAIGLEVVAAAIAENAERRTQSAERI